MDGGGEGLEVMVWRGRSGGRGRRVGGDGGEGV